MDIKLDKPFVKHSKASIHDDKLWFLEELEAEILAFAEYMKHAKLALVIKDTLFVHGAICTNSYGWIPGESNNKNNDNDGHTDDIDYNNKRIKDTDVNEWVNKLNA